MARQKSMAFLDAYEQCFSRFRGTECTLWEIGCGYPASQQPQGAMGMGGSLKMMKDYLGPRSTIIGIDVIEACKEYEDLDSKIYIEIGSQSDESFLSKLLQKYGPPSIVIDDGSHLDEDIDFTFEFLYPHLSVPGVYAIEDCFLNHISGPAGYPKDFHDPSRFLQKSLKHVFEINQQYRNRRNALSTNTYKEPQMCTALGFMTTSISFHPNLIIYNKGVNCVHDQLPGPPHYEL